MDELVGSGVAPVLGTVGDVLPLELDPLPALLVDEPPLLEELLLFESVLPLEPPAPLFWLLALELLLSVLF